MAGEAMMCLPDSTGANWFRCSLGTVGCPRIHNGRTPHCIACAGGDRCAFHIEPVLEQGADEYYAEAQR